MGERVTHHAYGTGTILRPYDRHRVIVQFDSRDGYHGTAPLIIWAFELHHI